MSIESELFIAIAQPRPEAQGEILNPDYFIIPRDLPNSGRLSKIFEKTMIFWRGINSGFQKRSSQNQDNHFLIDAKQLQNHLEAIFNSQMYFQFAASMQAQIPFEAS